ncbi:MAG TPA: bifunctional methylenetetrahydrofolate dehydrogenase/methenyltetrahydrofolate cyclohydrolase FolD [bacterium]|nr:bifunctional methylenetetrahydrofolate dehydrogenase/methenyltetrahydrofolate cyclohydrolase FolD [bacterium]
MTSIIDGKKRALEVREGIAREVESLKKNGIHPGLAVVLVGSDPASQVYVRNKKLACGKAGIASFSHDLPETASEREILDIVEKLNSDPKVHGILVQLPLPQGIAERRILEAVLPCKDVDGFHPINVGRLVTGEPCLKACTPMGCMDLIDSTGIQLRGKQAVVVGRSNIVGKPAAIMLLERHATVTVCHSRTADLAAEVSRADVLVAAVGRARMIRGEWIKPGAVVIDVGINRTEDGKLCGDVDFESAMGRAGAITPVPGGVGPMTIAMLLKNTVEAAKSGARS